jgi:hypothetical protein
VDFESNLARIRREKAITKLRKLKPLKLPPVPTHDEMLAMARKQCPDRGPEVVKRLAAHMHAVAVTGSNSGESVYSRGGDDRVTGDIKYEEDTHYEVTAPAAQAAGLPPDPPMPPRPKVKYA